MKHVLAFAMIAVLLPTATAFAKNPCRDDREKFCADVKASGGKVADCLEKHINELSAECKAKLTEKGKLEEPSADKSAEAPADGAAPGSAEAQAE